MAHSGHRNDPKSLFSSHRLNVRGSRTFADMPLVSGPRANNAGNCCSDRDGLADQNEYGGVAPKA